MSVSCDGSRLIYVDNVEVRLDPMVFAVVSCIAKHNRSGRPIPITTHTIVEDLLDDFGVRCNNVEDAVYKARKSIKEGFESVGRSIDPAEEIIASTRMGGAFAYYISASTIGSKLPPANGSVEDALL